MHSSIVRWPLIVAVLTLGAEGVAQTGPTLPDPGTFERTRGQMQTPRVAFGAAALAGARVLVAGGQDANAMATATAEIYNAKQQTFIPTATPMSEERFRPTLTTLADGRVLIAGGRNAADEVLASAEIYDPKRGTFEAVANTMSAPRAGHIAVLLEDDTVLIAAGFGNDNEVNANADIFDPRSNRFRPARTAMIDARASAAAALLQNGSVLIAGGENAVVSLQSAETYEPRSGSFTATTPMSIPRRAPTMNVLDSGAVLVAGGSGDPPPGTQNPPVFDSAELYHPATRAFTQVADPMSTPRMLAFSATLRNGRVLVCGGFETFFGSPLASCDAFNPRSATFTAAPDLNVQRADGAAVVVDGVGPLFLGGTASSADALGSGEDADPSIGDFAITGGMSTIRRAHAATALPDDRVLITGGFDGNNHLLASAEIYDPKRDLVQPVEPMSVVRAFHVTLPLDNGNVLVVGGSLKPIAEIFDAKAGRFRATRGSMTTPRIHPAAVSLRNGRILVVGGADETGRVLATAEIYDPTSETFVATGDMSVRRQEATATLLLDGRVLVTGGTLNDAFTGALSTAEIYNPATGRFTPAGNEMSDPRTQHTATLLNDGRVLIAGGGNTPPDDPDSVIHLASLELFDPASGRFSPSKAPLAVGRFGHTATSVAGGLVLIAGGTTLRLSSVTTELFDPRTGAPSMAGDMNDARSAHTATLVDRPGRRSFVLVTGGISKVPPNQNGTLASTERWSAR